MNAVINIIVVVINITVVIIYITLVVVFVVVVLEISDGADWQKRYCVLVTEERRLYFFLDHDVSNSIFIVVYIKASVLWSILDDSVLIIEVFSFQYARMLLLGLN